MKITDANRSVLNLLQCKGPWLERCSRFSAMAWVRGGGGRRSDVVLRGALREQSSCWGEAKRTSVVSPSRYSLEKSIGDNP